jgi:hypothetical protein
MKPGYACDNEAGIYFEDNTVKRVVSTRPEAKVYFVSVVDGKVVERVMEPEHRVTRRHLGGATGFPNTSTIVATTVPTFVNV